MTGGIYLGRKSPIKNMTNSSEITGTNDPQSGMDPSLKPEHDNIGSIVDQDENGDVVPFRNIFEELETKKNEVLQKKNQHEQLLEQERIAGIRGKSEEESKELEQKFRNLEREFYQGYLTELGDICEEAIEKMLTEIHHLTKEKQYFAYTLHDLEESVREIEKMRRKVAFDLKRRIEEKKIASLEEKISLMITEHEAEKERGMELERQIQDLENSLALSQNEIRKRSIEETSIKDQLSTDLKKQLEEEIRRELEPRIRDELNTASQNAIFENPQMKIELKRAVKQPTNKRRIPFVRCPSCGERIQVQSNERPLTIQCPTCQREYLIKEKNTNINTEKNTKSSMFSNHVAMFPEHENEKEFENQKVAESQISGDLPSSEVSVQPSDISNDPQLEKLQEDMRKETKEITCPYCGKVHTIPLTFAKRITCSCGRRIKTTSP